MGQFSSQIFASGGTACSKHTNPSKPNWISVHSVATDLSVAEVERLWKRFKQLGCNEKGELTQADLSKHSINSDPFCINILRLFRYKNKVLTFENFLRGLKWCEMSTIDQKLKGIFIMLNDGEPVKKDLFKKIIEKVYTRPEDKGNIDRVVEILYKQMDPQNKGVIKEDNFVKGCRSISDSILEQVLNFELLPNPMKEELHRNLPEFSSGHVTPLSDFPTADQISKIVENIHNKDWHRLANKLDFTSTDLDELNDQYPNNKQQVSEVLKRWQRREGHEATSSRLAQLLTEVRMNEAAAMLT